MLSHIWKYSLSGYGQTKIRKGNHHFVILLLQPIHANVLSTLRRICLVIVTLTCFHNDHDLIHYSWASAPSSPKRKSLCISQVKRSAADFAELSVPEAQYWERLLNYGGVLWAVTTVLLYMCFNFVFCRITFDIKPVDWWVDIKVALLYSSPKGNWSSQQRNKTKHRYETI